MRPGLSKSKILSGLQCPKRLYLEVHRPELAVVEETDQFRMDMGGAALLAPSHPAWLASPGFAIPGKPVRREEYPPDIPLLRLTQAAHGPATPTPDR